MLHSAVSAQRNHISFLDLRDIPFCTHSITDRDVPLQFRLPLRIAAVTEGVQVIDTRVGLGVHLSTHVSRLAHAEPSQNAPEQGSRPLEVVLVVELDAVEDDNVTDQKAESARGADNHKEVVDLLSGLK